MRYASVASWVAAVAAALLTPIGASAGTSEFLSRASVIEWIDGYRNKPEPSRMPDAVRALSVAGALREPETAGFYVGFAAGVLGANPKDADRLIAKMLPLPPSDQWLVVRAIAYSGLPAWKSVLARVAAQLPARRGMIDSYLTGALPTLDAIELDKSPTFLEKVGEQFGVNHKAPAVSYSRNPELVDTLWGQYFAAGQYRPIWRIITLLPWSKDRDSGERLTVGSAAKYTLANNAARYPDVLMLIKDMAVYQDADVRPILTEVIHAAETTETAGIRKEQVALVDKLKSKGPGYQHDLKTWGYVGQGAIGITCIVLATVSLSAAGLPCVIGGAAASAALNYWAAR
ncbi:MAG: hypothetical protein QOF09_2153 [Alphaproteobacteria bacterium]|jgi:hypothetical protein|nr:hypothetical protein [Alphaproteobacteria bacterium]